MLNCCSKLYIYAVRRPNTDASLSDYITRSHQVPRARRPLPKYKSTSHPLLPSKNALGLTTSYIRFLLDLIPPFHNPTPYESLLTGEGLDDTSCWGLRGHWLDEARRCEGRGGCADDIGGGGGWWDDEEVANAMSNQEWFTEWGENVVIEESGV